MAGNHKLMTLAEAAQYLAVKEREVEYLWESKKLGGVKIGRNTLRFDLPVLDAFIESHSIKAKAS